MPKFNSTGIHIIADLYGCDFKPITGFTPAQIRESISVSISNNSLTELGNYYHFFDNGVSFTAVISLAESHISIHTWPEEQYVSIDVFICNYTMDKTRSAEQIYKELTYLFNPQQQRKQTVYRERKTMP